MVEQVSQTKRGKHLRYAVMLYLYAKWYTCFNGREMRKLLPPILQENLRNITVECLSTVILLLNIHVCIRHMHSCATSLYRVAVVHIGVCLPLSYIPQRQCGLLADLVDGSRKVSP